LGIPPDYFIITGEATYTRYKESTYLRGA
jgi:hypothetical protein